MAELCLTNLQDCKVETKWTFVGLLNAWVEIRGHSSKFFFHRTITPLMKVFASEYTYNFFPDDHCNNRSARVSI